MKMSALGLAFSAVIARLELAGRRERQHVHVQRRGTPP